MITETVVSFYIFLFVVTPFFMHLFEILRDMKLVKKKL